jgi:peptidoglycan/LPS O-acetylase OafA/YrhL
MSPIYAEASAVTAALAERAHERRPGFRKDIQGLRAIAILMVLGYHAGLPGFGGGFAGVDVFFAISGYLIIGLLVRESEDSSGIDLARFYARRMRRLLPASLCMAACTLLAGWAFLSPIELTRLAASATAASAYASNLWFLKQSTNYFNSAVGSNPLLHTWSLSVEEQFYLVCPALIALCMRKGRTKRALTILFLFVGAMSFGANIWLTHSFQSIAFFSPLTRAWEFVLGGLASLMQNERSLQRILRPAIAWMGAMLVIGSAVFLRPENGFPGLMAAIPVVGTTLLLLCSREDARSRTLTRLLESRAFQWIGDISYSLYLWHWPVLVFGAILLRDRSTTLITFPLLVLSGLIATASHEFLEKRIQLAGGGAPSVRHWIRVGLAMTATGIAVGLAFTWLGNRSQWLPPNAAFAHASAPDAIEDKDCLTGFRSDRLKPCTFGQDRGEAVVLWGDSHAAQWLPALRSAAETKGWRLILLAKASCPSAMVPVYNPRLQRNEEECVRWRRAALSYIKSIRPRLLLISNSSAYIARPGFADEYARLSSDEWEAGVRSTLNAVSPSTGLVVLLRDTPRLEIDVPVCLARAASHPGIFSSRECDVSPKRALAGAIWQTEASAAAGFTNAALLDMTDQFCTSILCPARANGIVVYRDGNHMSLDYSRFLGKPLAGALDSILEQFQAASTRDSRVRNSSMPPPRS